MPIGIFRLIVQSVTLVWHDHWMVVGLEMVQPYLVKGWL